jgi:hypothetical protein
MTARRRVVTGRAVQGARPDWRPLARIMGEDLLSTFMWMYEVETAHSRRLHVYKHIETRRSLHLDRHGNAYAYLGDDRYSRVALSAVLEEILRPWWEDLNASPEEVASAWVAIDQARAANGRAGFRA